MGAPERLAMLNAKTSRFDVGSGGGQREITWENYAGALGLCYPEAAMTARAILLHDVASLRALTGRLMGVSMRWQIDQDRRSALVLRIVKEAVHPDHCGTCGGRGEAMIGDVKAVCPSCGGSGINRGDWSKMEAPAADAVRATLFGWLRDAMRQVDEECENDR